MIYDAIVIAGGRARRLGGVDKPAVTVGGRTLLDRTLAACADASRTVVVGPRRPTVRPVHWTREQRPGSGPLAAVGAGLREATADVVLLLAADLPWLRPETVHGLLAALGPEGGDRAAAGAGAPGAAGASAARVEGVLLHDGRDQPLLAVYRTEALRRETALIATEHGRLDHLPLRLLTEGLALRRLPAAVPGTSGASAGPGAPAPTASEPDPGADCDTWDDIAAARARIREHGRMLEEWIAAVKAELDIDPDVDIKELLDLARDAAHGVDRPAAPLTTFLVGYAAARGDGSPREVTEAARRAAALAHRWSEETPGPAGSEDAPPPKAGD